MEDRVIKIPMKKNPVLLDKIIQDIQTKLKEKLTWLDYAFGRAYKLVQHQDNGGKFIYPAAYIGNSDYISLLPDDNYGNFCWFDIYDSQKVINVVQSTPQFTISGAIIFWFNLDSIFSDNDAMYNDNKNRASTEKFHRRYLEKYKPLYKNINLFYNMKSKDYGVKKEDITNCDIFFLFL